MSKRLYDYLKITDLKDMLNKTNELYGKEIAYKIKLEKDKYVTYTHFEVRKMVNSLRNRAYRNGFKK